jgi:hypothetical protein
VDEGLLVDGDGLNLLRGWLLHRQRQEALSLLGEAVGDGAPVQGRVGPRVRHLVEEDEQLAVALLDAVDVAACQEALAQVADGSLDATLLVGLSRRAHLERDAIPAREFDELRVETHVRRRGAPAPPSWGLSKSQLRAQPSKYSDARARLRSRDWADKSKTNSAHIARLHESTMTKSHSGRSPPVTRILPA